VVGHRVLVPAAGVRVPSPQPCKETVHLGGLFALLREGVMKPLVAASADASEGSGIKLRPQELVPRTR
jgi:hypothetical protein